MCACVQSIGTGTCMYAHHHVELLAFATRRVGILYCTCTTLQMEKVYNVNLQSEGTCTTERLSYKYSSITGTRAYSYLICRGREEGKEREERKREKQKERERERERERDVNFMYKKSVQSLLKSAYKDI